jgi:hypothetical protein
MEELKQNIMNDITNSKLPAECVYYLLKDVFREYENAYINYLSQQKKQEEEKQEKQKEKNKK